MKDVTFFYNHQKDSFSLALLHYTDKMRIYEASFPSHQTDLEHTAAYKNCHLLRYEAIREEDNLSHTVMGTLKERCILLFKLFKTMWLSHLIN